MSKNSIVKLTKLDERLKSIDRIRIGSVGRVLAERKLNDDPELMLLVKFQNKACPVSVQLSQIEEIKL